MPEASLTQYGLMAERHWRQFRPKMVRRLEAQGKLEEALLEAQERTVEETEALYRRFKAEGLTEQQKYILLEPEPGVAL